jgi:hypothetical protein
MKEIAAGDEKQRSNQDCNGRDFHFGGETEASAIVH